jgi:hypothetical protein
MNKLGARSNSGEGGEDPKRYNTNKSSKITSTTQTGLVRNYVVYFGLFLLLLIALFIATPLVQR